MGKATGTGLSASLEKQDGFGPRSWPWAESSTGPSSAPAPAGVRASPGGVGAAEAAGHRSCPTVSWTRRWRQPGQVRAASYYPQEKGQLESTPHSTPLKFPILGVAPAGFGCPGRVWYPCGSSVRVGSCLGSCRRCGHAGGGQTGEEEARERRPEGAALGVSVTS